MKIDLKFIKNIIWTLVEKVGSQIILFVVQILLTRGLSPKVFSIFAINMLFIVILDILVRNGILSSLIKKEVVDDLDFSTLKSYSFFVAAVLYTLIFILSPIINDYYNFENLTIVLRVQAIVIFIGGIISIQTAILSRDFRYKEIAISNFIAVFISSLLAIILAFNGFGIWSIVVQYMSRNIVQLLIQSICLKKIIGLKYSHLRFKTFFKHKNNVMLSSLISTLNYQIFYFIVGKKYPQEIPYYNRGFYFPLTLTQGLLGAVSSVSYTAFSKDQNNIDVLKTNFLIIIRKFSFIYFPVVLGFTAISKSFITVLLTEKWLPSLPYLYIGGLYFLSYIIVSLGSQVLYSLDKSKQVLIINVISILLQIFGGISLISFGVFTIAIYITFVNYICLIIYFYFLKKYLKISIKELFDNLKTPLFMSLIMSGLVFLMSYIDININILLFTQIISGFLFYSLLSFLFYRDSIKSIRNILFAKERKNGKE